DSSSATSQADEPRPQPESQEAPLRLALVPERDIFEQRRRYQRLADYLAKHLQRPVEVVTENTYEGVLQDFQNDAIDAAFLGSFISVLAMDRHDARVLVKPEIETGVTTYHGVIFTRADSPIRSLEELAGKSIAMVKGTTAADLFPIAEMKRLEVLNQAGMPTIRWVGTHDEAIREVMEGNVDLGAAKNLRLDAFESQDAGRVRRLAVSEPVPNNALLVDPVTADVWGERLRQVLLGMNESPEGRQVLAEFGTVRFVDCKPDEYEAVYRMINSLGSDWVTLGVRGPIPGEGRKNTITTGG
ncbi:MAG: phosphate/phosphite/phosphonate ABC transporter substrate-binding protein, partial [Phycisphaerales bacterium JB038]